MRPRHGLLPALAFVLLLAMAATPADAKTRKFKFGAVGTTIVDGPNARMLLDVRPLAGSKLDASDGFGAGAASFAITTADTGERAKGSINFDAAGSLRTRFTYTVSAADETGASAIAGRGRIRSPIYVGRIRVTGTRDAGGLLHLQLVGRLTFTPLPFSGRGH